MHLSAGAALESIVTAELRKTMGSKFSAGDCQDIPALVGSNTNITYICRIRKQKKLPAWMMYGRRKNRGKLRGGRKKSSSNIAVTQ